jgi:hypothetical protein
LLRSIKSVVSERHIFMYFKALCSSLKQPLVHFVWPASLLFAGARNGFVYDCTFGS